MATATRVQTTAGEYHASLSNRRRSDRSARSLRRQTDDDEDAFAGYEGVLGLARYQNVAIKESALACYTRDVYPYRALFPQLKRVYDAFGPQRIFWGTDLSRLPCTYAQSISMFTEEIEWLSAADKEWIMGRGLCEWLDWPRLQA